MKREQFIKEYAQWLEQGTGAVFVGAGLSRQAGYPGWHGLLTEIAAELQIDLSQEHDLAGVAQWYINKSGRQRTRIAQIIKDSFPDKSEVPQAHRILARLPIRNIWTTNYDRLVERAWALQRRNLDVKSIASDLSVSSPWADTTLYKMHGSVDHPADVVIATDDYELYRKKRAGFLQVLNGHLIALHCLFLGFSFSDPNIGHLLAIIRESMGEHATQHYAIIRKPQKGDDSGADKHWAYAVARHSHWVDDLQRYGINCVEIDDYAEIDSILSELEGAVARRSVFVAGSYPDDLRDKVRARIESIATRVGQILGERKLRLVSGFGLTVGSAVIAGVLSMLYKEGVPSLDRSLYLRPFPQTTPEGFDQAGFHRRYREDMMQQAGVCIFVGGVRQGAGSAEIAQGVIEEYEIAKALGKVIVPVAVTGGAAAEIWNRLNADGGGKAAGLSDAVFAELGNVNASTEDACAAILAAINAVCGKP
ncbi:SIR2 family protein [Ralstonia pseudosolanacearum]|uniref:SIR2 family protein n=1 Tax=Ralstonia pseudosolanacearum TaxID=1310165 RepID=UPI0018D16154|nr:SIR2 family protein [Ralstonia pseudosolanacearum]